MSVSTVSVEQITRKRKRGWLPGWLVWSMLIVATGVSGLWYYQSRTFIAAVPHYITQNATKGSITVAVSAVGTVEPIDQVDVSSEISGIVREIKVAINDNVKTGQVMASLDTSALAAELARDKATLSSSKAGVEDVQATLDEATQTLNRMQTMMDRGVATQETLTTAQTVKRRADAALASAKANVEVAQADLQVSQANLDKAFIYAPMDGVILARGISVGQTVSASTTPTIMFTLAHDLGQMKLQVDVDEADIGKVTAGDPATFTVEAYQGQSFPAKVTELHFAPQTVDGIVTYQTILAIDNQAHLLRPGMTASADITVDQVTDKLIVPNA
ncbi:MAG: efflux RND transporter periplasmic adaptor subunit, partial [Paracoccaceae bacterium]